jgi:uncharacterized protein (DUF2384 family)
MPLVAFDLRHPELVAHELEEANRRLAREEEVPASITGLIGELAEQIADADARDLQAIDPYLWIELQQAALRALAALREDDVRAQRRQIRISLEQLRFLLTRLAERQPVSDDRSPNEVARWLDDVLAVSQQRKAELLGIGSRTYQRWISESNPTTPDADDEHVLRLLARLVNQLRHSLGGTGVVEWLEHQHDELDGARPIDALRDPDAIEPLLSLAVSTRSIAAA